MTKLQYKDSDWIFITPIDRLELTKAINKEFRINRVTLVSKDKLPRIRKRLNIPGRISEIGKSKYKENRGFKDIIQGFFKSSGTYAVLKYKGKPKEKEQDCIRVINDELNILALSQLFYSKRKFNRQINIKTSDKADYLRKISLNKHQKEYFFGLKKDYNPAPFKLDQDWINFHKRFFFFDLIKLIRGDLPISKSWRTTLHRVAILVGQSQNSSDLPSCFLKNVITLEMLLTNRGERIVDMLVKRSEYFFGWSEHWDNDDYEKRIRDIYDKRGKFVHNGDIKYIQLEDLVFLDNLIFNILNNIIRFRKQIKDRNDIIDITEKYEAEKLLGLKSKYRLKKFQMTRKIYNKEDYKEI